MGIHATILSSVTVTIDEFIDHLQVVTTINYNPIADFHNLQSLHINLLRLFPLIFTDF
jgi:hypothetical protein